MSVLDAVLLGIVQGLTEFLPVSSSGHLVMGQKLLGVRVPGVLIEVLLHVGTLLSVVIVYRARLLELLLGGLRGEGAALGYVGLLLLASVPAGIVGVLFEEWFERVFDTPAVTGFLLLVTGAFLWSTRYVRRAANAAQPDARRALTMGVAQAFAILPGISRSGATISAGVWSGLSAERAAEFSFLMSLPAVAGAAVLELGDPGLASAGISRAALAAGFTAALLSGILAIKLLIWFARRQQLHAFAYYLWPVGAAFLLYLALGA